MTNEEILDATVDAHLEARVAECAAAMQRARESLALAHFGYELRETAESIPYYASIVKLMLDWGAIQLPPDQPS